MTVGHKFDAQIVLLHIFITSLSETSFHINRKYYIHTYIAGKWLAAFKQGQIVMFLSWFILCIYL